MSLRKRVAALERGQLAMARRIEVLEAGQRGQWGGLGLALRVATMEGRIKALECRVIPKCDKCGQPLRKDAGVTP